MKRDTGDIAIRARGLVKSWRGRRVLDNVDLELRRGHVTAVLGASGTGKSTLLRVIAGLEDVDSGQVSTADDLLTDGQIIVPPEHRNVGLVFQDFSLFPHLSALENVMFGLNASPITARRETALERLASVQMADKAAAYPHTLSGGEQQRVALARALAPQPDIVLLDEAFSGLDARLRVELRNTALHALKASGAAVLIVTHDAEEALFMADELALMVDGAIVQRGKPGELYLQPKSLAAAQLLGEINAWTGMVQDGKLHSPFGDIDTAKADVAENATLLVRPEGVILTPSKQGDCQIVEVHPLGAMTAITFRAPNGEIWHARGAAASPLRPGMMVDVALDPTLMTIVPAQI